MTPVALAAAFLAAALQAGGAPAIRVGEDRAVAVAGPPAPAPLIEPHLSVHPSNPKHLLAGAIVALTKDHTTFDCAAFVSFDGGAAWQRRDLGLTDCADPWTAFLPDGTAILSVLGRDALLVYRSADGGRTWSEPVTLAGSHDHETLAVDASSGPRKGSLYVFSVDSTKEKASGQTRDAVFVARSDDGGRSFGEPTRVFPSSLSINTMTGVVLSDGTLAVSFADYGRASLAGRVWLDAPRAWIVTSPDGGKTFSAPIWMSQACGRSFPFLVADASSGPFRDRLYWTCNGRADGRTALPDYERVSLEYSPDRGERWAEPVRVNSGSGTRPYVRTPAIAVNRDGVVGISWYDGRNEKNRTKSVFQCLDMFFAASLDGGQTFLPEVRVSTQSSCADSPGNGDARYRWPAGGDYHGLVARPDGSFQLLWADSRDGTFKLRTAEVAVAGRVSAGTEKQ